MYFTARQPRRGEVSRSPLGPRKLSHALMLFFWRLLDFGDRLPQVTFPSTKPSCAHNDAVVNMGARAATSEQQLLVSVIVCVLVHGSTFFVTATTNLTLFGRLRLRSCLRSLDVYQHAVQAFSSSGGGREILGAGLPRRASHSWEATTVSANARTLTAFNPCGGRNSLGPCT